MDSDPNGGPASALEHRLNVLALVIYIPPPLGIFLDELRRDLVPGYEPHAHVSVLPPRCVAVDRHTASEHVRTLVEGWTPFEVELEDICTFPVTDVVYIGVGAGSAELRRMHDALNSGVLRFCEPFEYQPHITLVQEVPHHNVPGLRENACRRWSEYSGPRKFVADRATFVQNTLDDTWIDLAEYSMGAVALR
jgi:2'-5' RNA ligase